MDFKADVPPFCLSGYSLSHSSGYSFDYSSGCSSDSLDSGMNNEIFWSLTLSMAAQKQYSGLKAAGNAKNKQNDLRKVICGSKDSYSKLKHRMISKR